MVADSLYLTERAKLQELMQTTRLPVAYQRRAHESIETTQVYLDADLEMKQRILDKTTPPNGKRGRYRPEDKLLAFLKSL